MLFGEDGVTQGVQKRFALARVFDDSVGGMRDIPAVCALQRARRAEREAATLHTAR